MVQNGLFGNTTAASPNKNEKLAKDNNGKSIPWTSSETTIYRNAVNKVVQSNDKSAVVEVDSDIAFNLKDRTDMNLVNLNQGSSDNRLTQVEKF